MQTYFMINGIKAADKKTERTVRMAITDPNAATVVLSLAVAVPGIPVMRHTFK